MINIILIATAVLISLILAIQVLLFLKMAQLWTVFTFYMTAETEGQASPFGQLCQDLAKMIGQSAAMEIKTTLMGKASGEARLQTAIQGDMMQDQIQAQNPAIGMILDSFPTLKKRAFKNPGVVEYLLSHIGSAGVGSSASPGNNDFATRLNKYR